VRTWANREHERLTAEADDRDLSSRTDARKARISEEAALKELAQALVDLKPRQLQRLALPEDVHEAVRFAQSIPSAVAFNRQIRLIRQHLRRVGRAPIEARLEALRDGTLHAQEEAPAAEPAPLDGALQVWLERIEQEGDEALEALFSEHPSADRQAIRQRVRALTKARQAAAGATDRNVQRAERELSERLSELVGATSTAR
jgi:ribosome-associated protein